MAPHQIRLMWYMWTCTHQPVSVKCSITCQHKQLTEWNRMNLYWFYVGKLNITAEANQSHGSIPFHFCMWVRWRQPAAVQSEHKKDLEKRFKWFGMWWIGVMVPDRLIRIFHRLQMYWNFHLITTISWVSRQWSQKEDMYIYIYI